MNGTLITYNEFITEVIKDYKETKGTNFPSDLINKAHESYRVYKIFKGTVICLGETYQSVVNVLERLGNKVEFVNILDSSEKVVLAGSGLSIYARFANNDDLSELLKRHKEHNVSWLNESKDFFCYAAFPILNELEKVTKPAFNERDRKFKGFMYYPDINELFGTMKGFREYLGIPEDAKRSVKVAVKKKEDVLVSKESETTLTFEELAHKLFTEGSVTVNDTDSNTIYKVNKESGKKVKKVNKANKVEKELAPTSKQLSEKSKISVGSVYADYNITKDGYRELALKGSNDWSRLTQDELLSILVYILHSEGSLLESVLLVTQLGCPSLDYYKERFSVSTWVELLALVGFDKSATQAKEVNKYDVSFFEYFSNGLDLLEDTNDINMYNKKFKEFSDNPNLYEPFPSMGKIKEKYGTYADALEVYYLNRYKLFSSSATSEEERTQKLVEEFELLGRPATRLSFISKYYNNGNSKKYIPLEIINRLYSSYESYYLAMCNALTAITV